MFVLVFWAIRPGERKGPGGGELPVFLGRLGITGVEGMGSMGVFPQGIYFGTRGGGGDDSGGRGCWGPLHSFFFGKKPWG